MRLKFLSVVFLLSSVLGMAQTTAVAPTLFVDWSTIKLPTKGLPDGTRFANNKLRSNVAYDPLAYSIVQGKMRMVVDSQVPVDPTISSAQYHFRTEFTEWPWQINLQEGTEQWAGWSYYFPADYVYSVQPISIFQNHAGGSNPDPAFQLELTFQGQLQGAKGGEIQVINDTSNPMVRKMTKFRPKPGDRVDIVCHVIHARGTNGLLEFWINGVQVHTQVGNTIWPAPENWGGNNKWGIYHHTWTDPANVQLDIAAGHKKFALLMGNLRQITRSPSDPNYRKDSRISVDPLHDILATDGSITSAENEFEFSLTPVPVKRGQDILLSSNNGEPFEAVIFTVTGQHLKQLTASESTVINTSEFSAGLYFISGTQNGKSVNKKIVVLE
jgi:hypothetical protein